MQDQVKDPKTCQKIVRATMQNIPSGLFTRRREEAGFKKESSSNNMATECLEWEAAEREFTYCTRKAY